MTILDFEQEYKELGFFEQQVMKAIALQCKMDASLCFDTKTVAEYLYVGDHSIVREALEAFVVWDYITVVSPDEFFLHEPKRLDFLGELTISPIDSSLTRNKVLAKASKRLRALVDEELLILEAYGFCDKVPPSFLDKISNHYIQQLAPRLKNI